MLRARKCAARRRARKEPGALHDIHGKLIMAAAVPPASQALVVAAAAAVAGLVAAIVVVPVVAAVPQPSSADPSVLSFLWLFRSWPGRFWSAFQHRAEF